MGEMNLYRQDVFLINRLNSRYVCGRWDPTLRSGMIWLALCIVGAVSVFMLLMGLFAYSGGVSEILLAILPKQTIYADVTYGRAYPCGRSHRSTCHMITYAYLVNGHTYTREDGATAAIYNRAMDEERIQITYAQGFPQVAHVGPAGLQTDTFIFLVPAFSLAATILIPVWMILGEFAQLRHYRRQGTLIYGEITEVGGEQKSKRKTKSKPTRKSGGFQLTVYFTFRSPKGKTIKGNATRSRNDLKQKPLPEEGTPCAVLYMSDKDYLLL